MCGIFGVILNKLQSRSRRFLIHQLNRIYWRGPDNIHEYRSPEKDVYFGFARLKINDLSELGDQPMTVGPVTMICNGEIYNFKKLQQEHGFEFKSGSDCEIIPHLFLKYGIEKTIKLLDGYFAFIIHDTRDGKVYVGRDQFGVRPIFIGKDKFGNVGFASEAKCLIEWCDDIKPFPPSHYWSSDTQKFVRYVELYTELRTLKEMEKTGYDLIKHKSEIKQNFLHAVEKRLMSDREIGCFLSGGLDSSIVAGVVHQYFGQKHLQTFSIGMEGAPDLKYAGVVSKYIQSNHHNVNFHTDDIMSNLEDLIYTLESYDVTTIRASLGMYLLAKYVRKNSNCVVMYSGEGSDEVTQGYLYFHKQPSAVEGAKESERLINDLYLYDVLRCDRTTAAHGLEVRVPFLDNKFVQSYLNLPVDVKSPQKGVEKYTFRELWEKDKIIPSEVLWRVKEAFSDGVSKKSKSLYSIIQDHANSVISDKEFQEEKQLYNPVPISKEALYYRRIYNKYYAKWNFIPYYWVPQWTGQSNPDPSARKLDIYAQTMESDNKQTLKPSV